MLDSATGAAEAATTGARHVPTYDAFRPLWSFLLPVATLLMVDDYERAEADWRERAQAEDEHYRARRLEGEEHYYDVQSGGGL